MMKTSQAGLDFIARQEGEVLHVYKDQVGVPTIGIGHALKPGESFPNGITHEQALDLLREDVSLAEEAINARVKVNLTQEQFDALASFTFNLGTHALASSTLLILLNEGRFAEAANEFPKWDHAGGVVNAGILRRRNEERDLFLTPPSERATVPDVATANASPAPIQVIAPDVSRELQAPAVQASSSLLTYLVAILTWIMNMLCGGR